MRTPKDWGDEMALGITDDFNRLRGSYQWQLADYAEKIQKEAYQQAIHDAAALEKSNKEYLNKE